MEDVDLRHAKENLEELIERARRGEDVRISDDQGGVFELKPIAGRPPAPAPRKRVPGLLKGQIPSPPRGLFDPLSEDELKDWYGADA